MKWQLLISLGVVLVAFVLMSLRRVRKPDGTAEPVLRRSGWTTIRLTAGADNRDSTSKAVVLGWTSIVAWVVIATVLISKGDNDEFAGLMEGLGPSYFAVLGGPVLAAFLAKAVTDSRTSGEDPSVQKTEAAEPALGDLVTTDSGGLSVADAQYVILNLCAAAYVIYAFAKHPSSGVPEFPEQLALLTGGSAATYAGTKSWTANPPRITAMTPTRVDHTDVDAISIRGANLVSPGKAIKLADPDPNAALTKKITSSASATKVLIGGWEVPDAHVRASSDEIILTGLPAQVAATPGDYDVTVVTAAGLKATSLEQLKVV